MIAFTDIKELVEKNFNLVTFAIATVVCIILLVIFLPIAAKHAEVDQQEHAQEVQTGTPYVRNAVQTYVRQVEQVDNCLRLYCDEDKLHNNSACVCELTGYSGYRLHLLCSTNPSYGVGCRLMPH